MAWPSSGPGGGKNTSAIYYKGGDKKSGNTIFSKGHYISGQPKTLAMERGVEDSKNPLIQEAIKGVKERVVNKE